MSETNTEVKKEVASLGAVQRVNVVPQEIINKENPPLETLVEKASAEVQETEEQEGKKKETTDTTEKEVEFSDEQIQKYLETKGITGFKNIDEIKEKLTAQATTAELTPEEKAKAEAQLDKQRLEIFLKNGGTIESYAAIKQISETDLTELSKKDLTKELKDAGFDEASIEAIIKERYYQLNPDELEQGDDETEEDFTARKELMKKKVEYAKNKLVKRGEKIQNTAKGLIENLTKSITESNLQKREFEESEKQLSSKVDEYFSKIPKKITFELGEIADSKVDPVLFDVEDSDIKEVQGILKNREQRENLLYDKEGNLNVEAIGDLMLRNKILEKAVKASFIDGGSRQVAIFRKTFPHTNPHDLGIGGVRQAVNTGKQQVAGFGKTQRVGGNR